MSAREKKPPRLESGVFHVYLHQLDELKAASRRTGRPQSAIVRIAIARELARKDPGAPVEVEP